MKTPLLTPAIEGLLHAYAAILFTQKTSIGALFLLATFYFPNAGVSGLLSAVIGMLTAKIMRFPHVESGRHIYNSLLVGLALGISYQLDIYLGVLILIGSIMAVFATVALADIFWRVERLPALSLPFVIVALLCTLAAHSYGTLSRYLLPLAPVNTIFSSYIDQFLTALGSSFFTPHPLAGALLFIGVLISSRYMAMLAITGYVLGFAIYSFLSGSPHPDLVAWNGFNFILVSIALGGVFAVPSLRSFMLAMSGSAFVALVTAAAETFMLVYGLPVMALPYLLTTMLMLVALQKRTPSAKLQIILEAPDMPERSFERARLVRERSGELDSVPLATPFYGLWTVYQGFNGRHTHKKPWQHALDFYIVDKDSSQSFTNNGVKAEDFFCYSLPIISPAQGYVVSAIDSLPDNDPGEVDLENNWGNHIVIRMYNGLYVLLAHLKHKSVSVRVGDYVDVGYKLALCGSSGRSPQPHLHMQVQWNEKPGSATNPFHLTTVLSRGKGTSKSEFHLFARPVEGDTVSGAVKDSSLSATMRLPVGREYRYRVVNGKDTYTQNISVELTLEGQYRLKSATGASSAFEYQDNLLAFYDRRGSADPLLDAIILSLGLTPFAKGVLKWDDSPSMALFPNNALQRVLGLILHPLGGGLTTTYRRENKEEHWVQSGEHTLEMGLGLKWQAHTQAQITAQIGLSSLKIMTKKRILSATLMEVVQQADEGIPQWTINTASKGEKDEI